MSVTKNITFILFVFTNIISCKTFIYISPFILFVLFFDYRYNSILFWVNEGHKLSNLGIGYASYQGLFRPK